MACSGAALAPAAAFASALPASSLASSIAPAFGNFAAPPTFGTQGYALVVYSGGNIDQLEIAALAVGAKGVWVQDTTGRYALLPVSGPTFLKDGFASAFPAAGTPSGATGASTTNGTNGMNFPNVIAVTLVR